MNDVTEREKRCAVAKLSQIEEDDALNPDVAQLGLRFPPRLHTSKGCREVVRRNAKFASSFKAARPPASWRNNIFVSFFQKSW